MSKAVKRIWENDKELYKLFFVLKCKNRKIKDYKNVVREKFYESDDI